MDKHYFQEQNNSKAFFDRLPEPIQKQILQYKQDQLSDDYKKIEWNNYKDDTGNYSKNTQRSDCYIDENPYKKDSTIFYVKNNQLMMRLQYSYSFSHKQKTFWSIGNKLEHVSTILHINATCLQTAKHFWYICMET